MASPQAEDGHTDIANEILEALWKINLSPYQMRVLLYLLRKTYGWHKKTDYIALSQFSKDIGIDRRLVHRTLQELEFKNMVVIHRDDKSVIHTDTHKRNKKKKTLRDSQKSNHAVKEFFTFWDKAFRERTGKDYFFNGGKEGNLTKKILKAYSPERLKELAGVFFKSQTKFFQDSGYTIGFFYSQINKVVIEAKKSW